MKPKTAHELARELLALPDLPVFHYDPSFIDACDEESDETIGRPSVEIVDPSEGMTAEEIEGVKGRGVCLCRFITINGDQPETSDRQDLSWAVRMVLGERERQRRGEGYDDAHDDKHTKGELSAAGASYAMAASAQVKFRRDFMDDISPPSQWPWEAKWCKLDSDPRRTLIKASALLLAEIERLDRIRTGERREWWVFSTCLSTCELMVECAITGSFGVVPNPTKEEWSRAYTAPSEPYLWRENSRVIVKREGPAKSKGA